MRKGQKTSEATKQKISEAMNRPEVRKKLSEAQKGKHHTEETKRKISIGKKGRPSPLKGRPNPGVSIALTGRPSPLKGRHLTEEVRKKISEGHKGKNLREDNPSWRGGTSFLPYPFTFNKELRQSIKDRDHNKCQNPYCPGKSKKLTVHHIDFDKENCDERNLITLCDPCNSKANARHRWQRLYREIVRSKYDSFL